MNTSKIYLHVAQFLLKTNQKLTEGLCTTKAVRKIYTKLGRKGRKTIGLGPVPLGGNSEEKNITWVDTCPGEWAILGAPVLGSYAGETSPLGFLRTTETNRRAVRSLNSTPEKHVHAGLPLGQGREKSALGCWLSHDYLAVSPRPSWANSGPDHSMSQCGTESGMVKTGEKTQPWDAEASGSGVEPGWCGSGHCWHLLEQCLRSSPDLWWPLHHSSLPYTGLRVHVGPTCNPTTGPGQRRLGAVVGCEEHRELAPEAASERSCQHLYRQCIRLLPAADMSQGPIWAPLASVLPSSVAKVPVWGEGKYTRLKETEPAWAWNSGLLLQQPGIRPWPCRVMMATEQRGSLASYLAPTLAPLSLVPPCTKVTAVSTPWGKTWLASMSNPALPSKALGTCNWHRDAPT